MRSGTLDAPAVLGVLRGRPGRATRRAEDRLDRITRPCAIELVARGAGTPCPTPGPQRRPRSTGRLPGNAHFSFPGCEGDALLMLLDAAGVECSTGSACTAGVAQPSHVLLAIGADAERGAGARSGSPSATPPPTPTSTTWSPRCVPAVHRARRAGLAVGRAEPCASSPLCPAEWTPRSPPPGSSTRATTSPPSTSRCRATRSRIRTGARGCCTLEDARDARRAADVLGVPFYVWDLAERFRRGRRRRLRGRVRRRAHAQSLPALQREDQVLGGPRQGGGPRLRRGRAPATTRGSSTGPDGPRAAPRGRPGQGPVVRPRGTDPSASSRPHVPARRLDQGRRPGRGRGTRPCRGAQAGQPRRLLHPRRRHGRLPARADRDRTAGRRTSTRTARCSARTTAPSPSPSGSARACRLGTPAADGRPALRARRLSGRPHRDGRAARGARGRPDGGRQRPWLADRPGRCRMRCTAQVRAHGARRPRHRRCSRAIGCT